MCPNCEFLYKRLEVCEQAFQADIWDTLNEHQRDATRQNNKTFMELLDDHVRRFHPDSSTDVVIMTGKALNHGC